jgi:hypothetical protein
MAGDKYQALIDVIERDSRHRRWALIVSMLLLLALSIGGRVWRSGKLEQMRHLIAEAVGDDKADALFVAMQGIVVYGSVDLLFPIVLLLLFCLFGNFSWRQDKALVALLREHGTPQASQS